MMTQIHELKSGNLAKKEMHLYRIETTNYVSPLSSAVINLLAGNIYNFVSQFCLYIHLALR